ncbi:MAG: nucleotidyltransferase family protein [Clostridiales bacterium]|jgi:glucose-1-phosphate thymidylyltransferase|nr:nucleotidyltransferase family protein [Clostridiales bacterium]
MKAILLCAGYATRLYPLTKDKPKALLPVRGKPILTSILEQVERVPAVDGVYCVSNHKFVDRFREWADGISRNQAKSNRTPVVVLDDGTTEAGRRLGAIGDINFCIEKESIDDELLIVAGDNFFTFDLLEYYDFYRRKGGDCVCAKELPDVSLLRQMGVAVTDGGDRIIRLVEKPDEPESNLAVYATYFYTRGTARLIGRYLAEGNKPDAPGYFIQWLYREKPVYVWRMNGECLDVGTVASYENALRRFGDG